MKLDAKLADKLSLLTQWICDRSNIVTIGLGMNKYKKRTTTLHSPQ